VSGACAKRHIFRRCDGSSLSKKAQALSKKVRALARIHPFVHSFAASITGGSWLARIRKRLTWEHTMLACSAEVIASTKRLYSSEAPLFAGVSIAPSGVAIDEQVQSRYVEEPFARKL